MKPDSIDKTPRQCRREPFQGKVTTDFERLQEEDHVKQALSQLLEIPASMPCKPGFSWTAPLWG